MAVRLVFIVVALVTETAGHAQHDAIGAAVHAG